jgi:DNA-binding LacI/PurR family transcriptional regulator
MFHGQGVSRTGETGAKVVDVARRAGVSTGTVSNVLNRPDVVAEATRARVREAIGALGFTRGGGAVD